MCFPWRPDATYVDTSRWHPLIQMLVLNRQYMGHAGVYGRQSVERYPHQVTWHQLFLWPANRKWLAWGLWDMWRLKKLYFSLYIKDYIKVWCLYTCVILIEIGKFVSWLLLQQSLSGAFHVVEMIPTKRHYYFCENIHFSYVYISRGYVAIIGCYVH